MPIYVDVSAAVHTRAGLGRYAASLAAHLDESFPGEISLFYNRDRSVTPLVGLEHVPRRTIRAGYKPWRMAVWLGQLARIGFDRLVPDATLFHATEHLLLPLSRRPTILTVHDLIYRLFPQHHKRLNYTYLNAAMPLFVRRANAIITISEASKRDLINAYGVPADKVHVVYEAASPSFQPQPMAAQSRVRALYGLPDRYLLYVGTIEPRKNLPRLLQAVEALRAQGLDIGLAIVGSKGWLYDDLFQQLERSPARHAVVLPGYLPDGDLPAVYAAAEVAVLASVYEGFGLPVLEAMASGVPVVCSHAASMPELGGDAARYFDPYSVAEMTAVIGQVLRDDALRAEMRRQGFAQAARFSWTRAAQETMDLYRRVIASGPEHGQV